MNDPAMVAAEKIIEAFPALRGQMLHGMPTIIRDAYAETLAAKDAEIDRVTRIANQRLCEACLERHPIDVMCPPHEARTTGQQWFRERLSAKDAEIARLRAELQTANDEHLKTGKAWTASIDENELLKAQNDRLLSELADEEDAHTSTLHSFEHRLLDVQRYRAKMRELRHRLKAEQRLRECFLLEDDPSDAHGEPIACTQCWNALSEDRDRLAAEVERLKAALAHCHENTREPGVADSCAGLALENERLAKSLEQFAHDTTETDTHIRESARRVLGNYVDGDSTCVPPVEEIVERLVKQVEELRRLLSGAR